MGLPAGFDPATGTFPGLSAPKIQSNYNEPSSYYTYSSLFPNGIPQGSVNRSYVKYSAWDRFNDAIKATGNWIDRIIEPVSGWLALIGIVAGVIGLLIWVFGDSNLFYIILRFCGACVIGYLLLIGLGIVLFCISALMKVVRFVFWNAWTLIIALLIAMGGVAYAHFRTPEVAAVPETEVYESQYDTYSCTASYLNVRTQPNKTSRVLGTLRKGQQVEVTGIENGFAEFEFNGQRGYASLKYLNKIDR